MRILVEEEKILEVRGGERISVECYRFYLLPIIIKIFNGNAEVRYRKIKLPTSLCNLMEFRVQ
jgi:hypothetical protein